jgi:cellulose synthase operon protein C
MERRADLAGLSRTLEERDLLKDTGGALLDVAFARRLHAVAALARLGDDDAIDALAPALHDPEPRVRAAALDAAGDDPPPTFLAYLASAVAGWRTARLHALRHRALAMLIRSGDPALGAMYVEALLDLTGDEQLDADDGDTVRSLLRADPSDAAPAAMASRLIPELRSEDPCRRQRAAALIVALGDEAIDPLIAALHNDGLRPAAIRVLGRLREPRSVPLLTEFLRAGHVTDRVAAADALGDVRDPRTADDLLQATFADALEVRDAALDALDRLGSAGVVVAVTGMLDPLRGLLAGRAPNATVGVDAGPDVRPRLTSGYGARAESSFARGVASASSASAASIQAVDHRANGVRTVTSRRT